MAVSRRSFLASLAALIAAPAVVPAVVNSYVTAAEADAYAASTVPLALRDWYTVPLTAEMDAIIRESAQALADDIDRRCLELFTEQFTSKGQFTIAGEWR